jgi:hypothetical protein
MFANSLKIAITPSLNAKLKLMQKTELAAVKSIHYLGTLHAWQAYQQSDPQQVQHCKRVLAGHDWAEDDPPK